MTNETPTVDQYWQALEAVLPTFAEDEQRAAITLYRELAKGSPVSATQLAAALDVPVSGAEALLDRDSIRCLVYPDEEGNVLGFGGLAAAPTSHELTLDGRTMWTWCAWDSLFIPAILGEQAEVESRDPQSGAAIRLTVTPEGIRSREPETTVVSFVALDAELFKSSADNLMGSFCHFVFFFESRESGEAWTAKHEGTFLLSLDEAADLAKRLNARNWGGALAPLSQTKQVTARTDKHATAHAE
jgi:alkylmercury lyase